MNRYCAPVVTAAILVSLAFTGCAVLGPGAVPGDMTVDAALASVAAQSRKTDDFTGTALARIRMPGRAEQTASVSIRSLTPERCRVLVKGFGGFVGAIVWTTPDSLYAYVPPDNTWLGECIDTSATDRFLAAMNLDVALLRGAFGIRLPDGYPDGGWTAALAREGRRAALVVSRRGETFRYVLEGPALRVVEEVWTRDGTLMRHKKLAGFREGTGGIFPRFFTIEHEDMTVVLEFSDFKLGSGLTRNDVSFTPPESAERLRFEPYQ